MPTMRFADLIEEGLLEIGDGYRAKLSELGHGGPLFLRAAHLRNDGRITTDGAEYFSVEAAQRVDSKRGRPGDTVVTTKGNSIGRTGFLKPWLPQLVYSPHLSYWRSLDPGKLAPGFLRYWAKGQEFRSQLQQLRDSTDMAPYLSLRDQKRLRITVPTIRAQEAVSRTLGALDDKIELNREMNRTLEATAQAIFRSWFVDFGPVVAKAAGRRPFGMDAATAALFPKAFVETGLGAVPQGWQMHPFSGLVTMIGGGTPKTSVPSYWGGDIPWFSVVDCPDASDVFVTHTEKTITERGLRESSACLLGPGTTIITARGTVGKLALVGTPMAMNQSCYGLVGRKGLGAYLTYFSSKALIDDLQRQAHGSVFDTITRATFDTVPCVSPPARVADAFELAVSPLLEAVREHGVQSRTLRHVRDLLLPKLLSGEIRVREAEKAVERVL